MRSDLVVGYSMRSNLATSCQIMLDDAQVHLYMARFSRQISCTIRWPNYPFILEGGKVWSNVAESGHPLSYTTKWLNQGA